MTRVFFFVVERTRPATTLQHATIARVNSSKRLIDSPP